MHQTHSNICKIVEPKLQQTEYKCDGIVTKHKNIILSVLTADCAPILFFDQKKSIIGACHAGWKGALNGIIENTLSSMKLLGANINNINCSIGPCIEQSSYDVKSDFFKIFVDKSTRNRKFFIEINKDKYMKATFHIFENRYFFYFCQPFDKSIILSNKLAKTIS